MHFSCTASTSSFYLVGYTGSLVAWFAPVYHRREKPGIFEWSAKPGRKAVEWHYAPKPVIIGIKLQRAPYFHKQQHLFISLS